MMKTFVLGAGGIGLLLEYLLVKNGCAAQLIARSHSKNSFFDGKLTVEGAIDDKVSIVCRTLEEIERFSKDDIIFVTVKASDTKGLLAQLKDKVEEAEEVEIEE